MQEFLAAPSRVAQMHFSFGPLAAALALMTATLTRRRRSRAPSRYATYGGASLAARGYEDPTVLDVVEAKTAVWARSLEAASFRATEDDVHRLLAIRTLGGDTVSVLDFGGACGATYYSTRHLLGPRPLLRWVIVETVGMAARVHRHASPFQAVSSVAAGVEALQGRVDLVHSAGTLQYTSDPFDKIRTPRSRSSSRYARR
jgi:putative methyltransferase (TIGR04325 family)